VEERLGDRQPGLVRADLAAVDDHPDLVWGAAEAASPVVPDERVVGAVGALRRGVPHQVVPREVVTPRREEGFGPLAGGRRREPLAGGAVADCTGEPDHLAGRRVDRHGERLRLSGVVGVELHRPVRDVVLPHRVGDALLRERPLDVHRLVALAVVGDGVAERRYVVPLFGEERRRRRPRVGLVVLDGRCTRRERAVEPREQPRADQREHGDDDQLPPSVHIRPIRRVRYNVVGIPTSPLPSARVPR
jgi:hypothetical protein